MKILNFTTLSTVIILNTLGFVCTSCKESTALPPSAKVDESSITWDFGKDAYLHTKNILDLGVRSIETEGHKKTQQYITSELEKHGWEVIPQSFKTNTPYGERTFTNLIARLKNANVTPDVVLSAHYDAKQLDNFLGADDAASCVAAILEIGEHLPKTDLELAKQMEFVFFDGEEALKPNIVYLKDGLYGSIYYSQYMRNDLSGPKKTYQQKPKFGVLLDMIGHKDLSIKIPSDTPYSLLKSYYKVVEKYKLEDSFGVARGSILDDHYPMNKIAGLPTIDLIGDFSSKDWWHTEKDNFSIISQKSLNLSIKVALELIQTELAKSN